MGKTIIAGCVGVLLLFGAVRDYQNKDFVEACKRLGGMQIRHGLFDTPKCVKTIYIPIEVPGHDDHQ